MVSNRSHLVISNELFTCEQWKILVPVVIEYCVKQCQIFPEAEQRRVFSFEEEEKFVQKFLSALLREKQRHLTHFLITHASGVRFLYNKLY